MKNVSFLFKEFNSIEDLKNGSYIIASANIATFSSIEVGCGFIPIPFLDIPPVLEIQVTMIINLAKIYGIKRNQYKLKDIILFGSFKLGDAAVNKDFNLQ